MQKIYVNGGKPLSGIVSIQGAKNGALPLMAASLLICGKTVLHNCPRISDIDAMAQLLETIGCHVYFEKNTITIDATYICDTHCPQKQVQAMRSSIMLLGPLLGRCKSVRMNHPGGCVIGKRPTDIHRSALEKMNVTFEENEEAILAYTDCLVGTDITLPFPSVGATENVIMAAVLAKGVTRVKNAAKEPEIILLCEFLNRAGADITGVGEAELCICGVRRLREVHMQVTADRIVAGTYMLAAAATGGEIVLEQAPTRHLYSVIQVLRDMGADVYAEAEWIYVDAQKACLPIPYIKTSVYPGFPTDLQSILLVALLRMNGHSIVEETIFEDRFKVIPYLKQMGAQVMAVGNRAFLTGGRTLTGTKLKAKELRGGAALVVAALAAKGKSEIEGIAYIERGYEDIVSDLQQLGADIHLKNERM